MEGLPMKTFMTKHYPSEQGSKLGLSVGMKVSKTNVDIILHKLIELADRNELIFCGGGMGRLIFPPEEFEQIAIPPKAFLLLLIMSMNLGLFSDNVRGYFIAPFSENIPEEKIEIICTQLHGLAPDVKLKYNIDLHN